jgi:hypothetical protein
MTSPGSSRSRSSNTMMSWMSAFKRAFWHTELAAAVARGESIAWVAYAVRSELFAHGRAGDKERQGTPLLSPALVDDLCGIVRTRLAAEAAAGNLLGDDEFINPLLLWSEAGGGAEALEWVRSVTSTDDGLLKFLESLKSMVRSTGGDYWRISPRLAANFFHIDTLKGRLQSIASTADAPMQSRALNVLQMLRAERD